MADILINIAAQVKTTIERLRAEYPELDDDADLLADTIDGETDFTRIMERLSLNFLDATSLKEANGAIISDLRERGERFGRKAEAYRAIMQDLLVASGQRKCTLPTATLSIAKGRARLVIDDEAALPQGFVKLERIPIKADIAAALSAGESIPGARLEQAPEHLSIRTK